MAKGGLFGIMSERTLPDDEFVDRWDRIVVAAEVKQRALNFMLFSLLGRARLSSVSLPIHGVVLLQGPPGTGKTTLAHGIADRMSRRVLDATGKQTVFAELDCHGIGSGVLGETPKHMDRIFEVSIPDLARSGTPTCVLLDEVENVAVARRQASLEANPMDVHRTTNALLTGIDRIRTTFPNVVFIATSNFPESIDEAFLSRVDVRLDMPLPTRDAIDGILRDTMGEVGSAPVDRHGGGPPDELLDQLTGWDARQVRKLVVHAIISDEKIAENPATLTWDVVLDLARSGRSEPLGASRGLGEW